MASKGVEPEPLHVERGEARVSETTGQCEWVTRRGRYVDIRFCYGGIDLIPTAEGIEEAKDRVESKKPGWWSSTDMLEDHLGNGWMGVPAEAIGALTGCEDIYSMDFTLDDAGEYVPVAPEPHVFFHERYAIEIPVQVWAEGRTVFFRRAQ